MLETLNFLVQKATALLKACLNHPASDGVDGISSEQIQSLQSAMDDVDVKNTDQEKAVEFEGKQTGFVNETMAKGHALITKTHNAAQAHYGKDNKARNREFHIGGKAVTSVKSMRSELKYLKSVATDNNADLAKHGFKDSDIANFDTISAELKTNSANQKNAQKLQKGATKERDASMKNLQKVVRSIQHDAQVIFEKEPSILVEFESISDGHHGAKAAPAPPVPEPQAQSTSKTK